MTNIKNPPLRNFIANTWHHIKETEEPLVSPTSGELLGYKPHTPKEDLDLALDTAKKLHKEGQWFREGPKRADYLHEISKALKPHVTELAHLESQNTGVHLRETATLMGLLPLLFEKAANQIIDHPDCDPQKTAKGQNAEVWRKPWGPALCLIPWNAPAPIACHKLSSAIAAGAPALVKPSEFTPYSMQRVFEIIADTSLPAGVAQLIQGDSKTGQHLVADSRIKAVSFTGGFEGGKKILKSCAHSMKPVQLELGGHNPFIIMEGADIPFAIANLLISMTRLNGQWCRAAGQVFCPEPLKQEVLETFLKLAAEYLPHKEGFAKSNLGPLIHRQHKNMLEQKILEYQALGANLIRPEVTDSSPSFMAPTLINNLPLAKDTSELFGPLATIHSYHDLSEVVEAVEEGQLGLTAYIFGPLPTKIMDLGRRLEVGSVKGNGVSMVSLCPEAPRSAWGKTGLNEEGDFETYLFFKGCSVVGMVQ